jgi:hypothetical protein
MNFLHTDIGNQSPGALVTVTLRGTEANVLLLDTVNFQSYKASRGYHYTGGHYKQSPVRLRVPHSGRWHVVVDLGGAAGSVNASVAVTPA